MAIRLIYQDIALGAAADGTVTTTPAESFSKVQDVLTGIDPEPVATCEPNGWGLVPDYKVRDKQAFAFWSAARSGLNCVFSDFPTLTIQFTKQYTCTGLTVRFGLNSMDYCRVFKVTYYQGSTIKDEATYNPTTPLFILNNLVESFDKVVFEFQETSLPAKRVKVEEIVMGVKRTIDGKELREVEIINEVDLTADTLPVNVLDADFTSSQPIEFMFQRKQPVAAYNDEKLLGTFYIRTGTRQGRQHFTIECEDAIGVLDIDEYTGGIWFADTALTTILDDVIGGLFEYEIDPAFANSTLRGYIEPNTRREALQSVGFALGAVIDTSNSDKIRIYPMPTGTGTEIPPKKTYIDGEVQTGDVVTEVTVTAYVIFDERPSDNDEYIEFNGVQYRYYTDTKHAYNPDVIAGDLPNKVKFDKSYLVNLSNAQTLADNLMNYYARRDVYSVKHVIDAEEVADRVQVTTPWGTQTGGNITKMTISATGIVVSDSEIVLD